MDSPKIIVIAGPNGAVRENGQTYAGLPPNAPDSVKGAYAALLRAAQRAREIARQSGTQLVVYENGQVVMLDPDDADLHS